MTTWYKVRSFLAAGVALIACPCHLPLTLPLLLSLTAGSALGTFLGRNTVLVSAAFLITFVGSLVLALRWVGSKPPQARACPPKTANPSPKRRVPAGSQRAIPTRRGERP